MEKYLKIFDFTIHLFRFKIILILLNLNLKITFFKFIFSSGANSIGKTGGWNIFIWAKRNHCREGKNCLIMGGFVDLLQYPLHDLSEFCLKKKKKKKKKKKSEKNTKKKKDLI